MPGLIPDAGPGWEAILLLPVPAAEPAVSRHRARLVESAKGGVPAHITVLYPFLPPAGIRGVGKTAVIRYTRLR